MDAQYPSYTTAIERVNACSPSLSNKATKVICRFNQNSIGQTVTNIYILNTRTIQNDYFQIRLLRSTYKKFITAHDHTVIADTKRIGVVRV